MNHFNFSVIICTYNPVEEIFNKCLISIHNASQVSKPAEIIIIDNNSEKPLSNNEYIKNFLTLNSNVRLVVEKKQGLTPARLRGISEAQTELLVFIDDDNFLVEDFFKCGLNVAQRFPMIGAFSGQVLLEFEVEPPEWTERYWGLLVYRKFEGNRWSNMAIHKETMPCGAGMFVKKEVADFYLSLHNNGKRNLQLDRLKSSLLSGGDNDLALCACDIGMGMGLFSSIKLYHYIPMFRTEKKYLLNLSKAMALSSVILNSFRNILPAPTSFKRKLVNKMRIIFMTPTEKQFHKAVMRGEKEGIDILKKIKQ